jgi:hypothetical protein
MIPSRESVQLPLVIMTAGAAEGHHVAQGIELDAEIAGVPVRRATLPSSRRRGSWPDRRDVIRCAPRWPTHAMKPQKRLPW